MPRPRDLGEYQTTLVRIPNPLYEKLRRLAFEQRRSQAEIVREALERYVADVERRGE